MKKIIFLCLAIMISFSTQAKAEFWQENDFWTGQEKQLRKAEEDNTKTFQEILIFDGQLARAAHDKCNLWSLDYWLDTRGTKIGKKSLSIGWDKTPNKYFDMPCDLLMKKGTNELVRLN